MDPKQRGRGRPAGSKDSRPRVYRKTTILEMEAEDGFDRSRLLSVEDQIRRLKHPIRVSILSDIRGLSEATLRKKIEQGKVRAFKRSAG
jgi:hypothetical protein